MWMGDGKTRVFGNLVTKPFVSMKRGVKILVTVALMLTIGYLFFRFSPWPSALFFRYVFDREGEKMNQALAKHVPEGITEILDQAYDEGVAMDIFYPSNVSEDSVLPALVWVHGGGWISGSKDQVGNYCRILASHGFVVASIDYSIAPEATYPTPVRQTMKALGFLQSRARDYRLDTARVVLAGDSGGAHIVAQAAAVITDTAYARLMNIRPALTGNQLKAMLLFCGAYDATRVNLDGSFGGFLRTVLWSYSGSRDFQHDPEFRTASVVQYVSKDFPRSFIAAGNADPLLPQSRAMAARLTQLGVAVDSLFFAPDYSPPLPHEFQFNLDTEAGQETLRRAIAFLKRAPQP